MDVELSADLRVRRRWIALEQSGSAHNDAGQAVAALACLLLNEGFLQRMERCAIPKSFDCCDGPAFRR
jgi:hypothetical protein